MDFDGSIKLCLVVPLVCFRDGLFVAAVVCGKLHRLSIASFNTHVQGLCPEWNREKRQIHAHSRSSRATRSISLRLKRNATSYYERSRNYRARDSTSGCMNIEMEATTWTIYLPRKASAPRNPVASC